jgi:ubiquinone/menaquinone biosynthesis C-methylase UbiE
MSDHWIPLPRYSLRKNLVLHILKKYTTNSKKCLEIGYGSGDLLINLSKLGLTTYGYEFSSNALKMATKKINKNCTNEIKNRIKFLIMEKQINLNEYDFVVALEVLEHVKDDMRLLKKIKNYLKKEGVLIFSVPAHKSKWGDNDIWAGHYRRYEKKELKKKLIDNEFEVLHIWSYGYPIILLLDLFIHRSHKNEIDSLYQISKENLSKRSGIKRKNTFLTILVSWKIWMLPFFYIQRLFLDFDWTSAFIVIARKK